MTVKRDRDYIAGRKVTAALSINQAVNIVGKAANSALKKHPLRERMSVFTEAQWNEDGDFKEIAVNLNDANYPNGDTATFWREFEKQLKGKWYLTSDSDEAEEQVAAYRPVEGLVGDDDTTIYSLEKEGPFTILGGGTMEFPEIEEVDNFKLGAEAYIAGGQVPKEVRDGFKKALKKYRVIETFFGSQVTTFEMVGNKVKVLEEAIGEPSVVSFEEALNLFHESMVGKDKNRAIEVLLEDGKVNSFDVWDEYEKDF
jgi:hypothetical protein